MVVRPLRRGLRLTTIALHVATRHKEEHMIRIALLVNWLRRNDEGQDLLEYALLVALIAIVAVASVTAAGLKVDAIFKGIVAALPLPS
jgi:Flp pilus assembly pilin Flp